MGDGLDAFEVDVHFVVKTDELFQFSQLRGRQEYRSFADGHFDQSGIVEAPDKGKFDLVKGAECLSGNQVFGLHKLLFFRERGQFREQLFFFFGEGLRDADLDINIQIAKFPLALIDREAFPFQSHGTAILCSRVQL